MTNIDEMSEEIKKQNKAIGDAFREAKNNVMKEILINAFKKRRLKNEIHS